MNLNPLSFDSAKPARMTGSVGQNGLARDSGYPGCFLLGNRLLKFANMKVQEMIEALRHDKPLLSEKFGVEEIAIFGSYARSEQREDSDIDFLVQLKEPKLASLVGVMEFLEGKFKRRIDIVAKHKHLSKRFWNIVGPDIIYV